LADKEDDVTPTLGGFAAFRKPVDREVFAPGFDLWQRASSALRRLWRAAIRLPDRSREARPDEIPSEYFRFPPF
jgi:hypothetical protein